MKIKAILTVALLLAFGLSMNAAHKITGVEYLSGEDFVQLHFKAGGMIPIPELHYPDKNDISHLVIKVNSSEIDLNEKEMAFDSPVIREMKLQKSGEITTINIFLREKLNPRLFTNTRGLFIEFPSVKTVVADKEVEAVEKKVVETAKAESEVSSGGISRLVDMVVDKSRTESVTVELKMSGLTEYTVLPPLTNPARLAIDLKNTVSGSFRKSVNCRNVKRVRGGYNKPNVFRLVFDLENSGEYSINRDGKSIVVTFGEEKKEVAENRVSEKKTAPAPAPVLVMDKPVKKEVEMPAKAVEVATLKPEAPAQDEFFGEEKADSKQQQSGVDEEQVQYLRKTIDTGQRQYTGKLVDLNFTDANLRDVLLLFAKDSGLSMAIDPGVTGKVTCSFNQVPWDQAMELFLKINGLDMVLEGNLLRIGKVEDLEAEAQARLKLKQAREKQVPLEVFTRPLSFAKADKVVPILKKQMSPRGEIITDKRTNTLIISEIPERIAGIDKLIDTLDRPNRQVSIHAKIVETTSNHTDAFGVQWGWNFNANSKYGNQTSLKFPNSVGISGNQIYNEQNPGVLPASGAVGYAINMPAQGRNFGTSLSLGNIANSFVLDVAISSLQKKGKARIISSPKTVTENNKEATLMQGKKIPVQTIQNNTVTTIYIPAALEMAVTPQITANGFIIMDLSLKNNLADWGNTVNNIPAITIQEIKNQVRVKDGTTLVIGGLHKVRSATTNETVPLLSKIPILGNLFKSTQKDGEKTEILIFITPRIIK